MLCPACTAARQQTPRWRQVTCWPPTTTASKRQFDLPCAIRQPRCSPSPQNGRLLVTASLGAPLGVVAGPHCTPASLYDLGFACTALSLESSRRGDANSARASRALGQHRDLPFSQPGCVPTLATAQRNPLGALRWLALQLPTAATAAQPAHQLLHNAVPPPCRHPAVPAGQHKQHGV